MKLRTFQSYYDIIYYTTIRNQINNYLFVEQYYYTDLYKCLIYPNRFNIDKFPNTVTGKFPSIPTIFNTSEWQPRI